MYCCCQQNNPFFPRALPKCKLFRRVIVFHFPIPLLFNHRSPQTQKIEMLAPIIPPCKSRFVTPYVSFYHNSESVEIGRFPGRSPPFRIYGTGGNPPVRLPTLGSPLYTILYDGINNSSTVSCNSLAMLKARDNVGSYLLFSIAFTVCRDTPHFFANSSCDNPSSFRLFLILFSISAAISFLIMQERQKVDHCSNTKFGKRIDPHSFHSDNGLYNINYQCPNNYEQRKRTCLPNNKLPSFISCFQQRNDHCNVTSEQYQQKNSENGQC